MDHKACEVRYLPLFYEDLLEAVDYIAQTLANPQAASDLLDDVERAIEERRFYPEAFEPVASSRQREHPYYPLYIRHFVAYYVVLDHRVMEMRRFLYQGQNREALL